MSIRRFNYTDAPLPRHERAIVFQCDGCGALLETMCSDFSDALGVLRDNAWRAHREDDGWRHRCEDCR